MASVALHRMQDVAVAVNDALRTAGGSRAVKPERRIVAVRRNGPRGGWRVLDRLPQRAGPTAAHHEHHRERARLGLELVGDGRRCDHGPRPRLAPEWKGV